ncbi:MAG: MazG-like family protein [Bacilli bacterium]|nr:hypothetical protein [Bacilli bacterium]
MVDLKELQKKVVENKIEKGFNVEDINLEFNLAYGELSEAFEAYIYKKDDLGEELADVVIYILGISEILGINLEEQLLKKIAKNKKRKYFVRDGKWQKAEG